jgi:N-acetylglucosamine-6-phosphate deacetylase
MSRRVVFPGFFDLQVNGFAGVDFNDPASTAEDFDRAAAALRQTGVTRFLPALITSSTDAFVRCARKLAAWRHPAAVGIHMEGPYLAADARGVHPLEHLTAASVDDFQRRQDAAAGRILVVTLAPEVPGALPLIEHLVKQNVRVSLGHTVASPAQVRDAVSAGATLSTHLGNGCPRQLPRHPNFLWEQLAADELVGTVIADDHHLPGSVVKVMVRAKTKERMVLVTDSVAAAGQPAGEYQMGDLRLSLSAHGRVTLAGTEMLAGSALTLDVAVGNTVRFTGLSLEEVWPMASAQPARAVGLSPQGRVTATWDEVACRLAVEQVEDDSAA